MKRANSSYYELGVNKFFNESVKNKNDNISNKNNKKIKIENLSPIPIKKFIFQNKSNTNSNREYRIKQNEYKSKYLNQIKRKTMFNELWNIKNNKKNNYNLLNSIKVQNKQKSNIYSNIIGNIRHITKDTRTGSAGTFCNIQNKKIEIPFTGSNSSININTLVKSNVRSLYNKRKPNINNSLNSITKSNTNIIYNNESSSNIQNQDIQSCYLSPINSIHNSSVLNKKENEVEKNNIENINEDLLKFLEDSKKLNKNSEINSEILKIRTEYLIKFSKISEFFQKLTKIDDYFRIDIRELYISVAKYLKKYFDIYNNFLLNEVKIGQTITIDFWSTCMNYLYSFLIKGSKLQKFFIDELHHLKDENLNLNQRINSLENELNQKKNEINDVNKLIIKYDLNTKIKNGKKLESFMDKIRNQFNNKESSYVLTIYKLEQEISNLTELLNQNKNEINDKNDLKENFKKMRKHYEDEIIKMDKINDEKDINIKSLTQRNSDLNYTIYNLEQEIERFKEKEEKEKEKTIYLNAKIQNLNNIINKNNEEIKSLKNEIENLNGNNKEKKEENINICNTILMPPK